jgi:hypothetical protein
MTVSSSAMIEDVFCEVFGGGDDSWRVGCCWLVASLVQSSPEAVLG